MNIPHSSTTEYGSLNDKGILHYIFSQKKYKRLLVFMGLACVIAVVLKASVWPSLKIYFFIFFSLNLPIIILVISLIPYSFHSNWIKLLHKFGERNKVRTNVRVYIKNFDPWKDRFAMHNWVEFTAPYYDFEKADIIEAKDFIIVYGKNDTPFSFYKNTRPFGICFSKPTINDRDLYVVNFISIVREKEWEEIVFADYKDLLLTYSTE